MKLYSLQGYKIFICEGCGGGIMALDGLTGKSIWYRHTPHELFAINCNVDLSGDGIKDCIVGGRMAVSIIHF